MDEEKELLERMVERMLDSRCPCCGFPLAESRDRGCVLGNCSFRPERLSAAYRDWVAAFGKMAELQIPNSLRLVNRAMRDMRALNGEPLEIACGPRTYSKLCRESFYSEPTPKDVLFLRGIRIVRSNDVLEGELEFRYNGHRARAVLFTPEEVA